MADDIGLAAMIAADNAKTEPKTVETTASEPTESDASTTETATPDAETETEETGETAGEVASEGDTETTIRDYAKEILGDQPWIDKYTDDDEFLKGIGEAQAMLGQRNAASETVRWMVEHGVTPDDLQRVAMEKAGQQTATVAEWDESWVSVNDKGEWQPTSKAPPDFAAKAAKYKAQLAEAMASPRKLAEFLKPHLKGDIDQAAAGVRQEMAAVQAAQQAAQEAVAWAETKKSLLYADNVGGTLTPLGKEVNTLLEDAEFYPNTNWTERAERALRFANAQMKTTAAPVKAVPQKAKHQTAVATGQSATRMTDTEFRKKYGNSLRDFARFTETGKTPDQA